MYPAVRSNPRRMVWSGLVRLPRAVARAALIVALAMVAAPGTVGSRVPSSDTLMDAARFREVVVPSAGALATTQFVPDMTNESAGRLDGDDPLVEPPHVQDVPTETERPQVEQPLAPLTVVEKPAWRVSVASFYGPGFYGRRTACGFALTTTLVGVAHRTLPCGTLITFRNRSNGRTVTMPVVDRGPYVAGREWDLTGGACVALGFCYTARIAWRFAD